MANTTLSTDTFNRANSTTSLGSTDGTGTKDPRTWTQLAGTWGINTNQAYISAASGFIPLSYVDLATKDVDLSIVLANVGSGSGGGGLAFRITDANNFYGLRFDSTGGSLQVVSGGSVVATLGTYAAASNGDTIEVVASGSTITVKRNGSTLGTYSDSTYTTQTKHGIAIGSDTTVRLDSWSAVANLQSLSVTQTQTPTLLHGRGKLLNATQTQTPLISRLPGKTIFATQTQTPNIVRKANALTVTQTQTPSIDALAGIHTTPSGSESAPTFAVKVTDMRGNVSKTLTLAEPDKVTWTLNAPDAFEFHFPKGAYTGNDVGSLVTGSGAVSEVQLYRNSDLLTWGPITQIQAKGSDGKITCKGSGPDWYLNRRFVDGPVTELLKNNDFESGLTNWTTIGATATSDTTNYYIGSKSCKLVATDDGNNQIYQATSAGPNGVGLLVILSGWFFIQTFNGPPPFFAGLFMEAFDTAGNFQGNNYYPIDSATPRLKWTKAETQMWIPPNTTWNFNIRLFAVDGTMYWDDIKCVVMDSLATETVAPPPTYWNPIDAGDIVSKIVAHEQDTSAGKSPLNIGMNSMTVGIKEARSYQYVDHLQFDQAIKEFTDRSDGFDYYVDLTPTTRTYTIKHPKRGTDRSGSVTLSFIQGNRSGSNCVDYDYANDGSQCITHQTILGSDHGPDREQGDYTDASNVAGIILEDVRQAVQGSTDDSLQPYAVERVKRYGAAVPQTIVMYLTGVAGLLHTIHCGDLVTCVVTDDFVTVNEVLRIQMIELDCTTNIIAVTLAKDTLT